ncbi:MAG: signal peptidase II [Oscillospiraceae bacterium]
MAAILVSIVAIVAADFYLSRWIADLLLEKGTTITLIKGIIGLRYCENTGAAFSIFEEHQLALTIVTLVILAALLVYLLVKRKTFSTLTRVSFVMVLAGGFCNLLNRAVYGYVIDYFEFLFTDYAIFNISDVLITVGAVLLVLSVIIDDSRKRRSGAEA